MLAMPGPATVTIFLKAALYDIRFVKLQAKGEPTRYRFTKVGGPYTFGRLKKRFLYAYKIAYYGWRLNFKGR